jgi:hypothetical protein
MNEQFRNLVVSACVLALALVLGAGASASRQEPTSKPAAAPPTRASKEQPKTTAPTTPSSAPATKASTAASSATPKAASAAESAKTTCLECHPYDSVIETSAKYVMPSGETGSPHRYINPDNVKQPHTPTGVEGIPECSNCHKVHALPPAEPIDLSKIPVEWCYTACHHQQTFALCSTCHKEEEE